MLLGIAGRAGSGKDTLANYLVANYSKTKDSFSAPIKAMLNVGFNWTPEQWEDRDWKEAVQLQYNFSPREAAQTLGTEWRYLMKNKLLWCTTLGYRHKEGLDNVVISDVRFSHEQDWIASNGGKVIFIHRKDVKAVNPHPSENSLNLNSVDYVINNCGSIDYFYDQIDENFPYWEE